MRFGWIDGQRSQYPLKVMCRLLEVSRGGFYAWRKRQGQEPCARVKRRSELSTKIKAVHEQSRRTYGSPRVYHELKAQGEVVCENTVAKLMRQGGIRSVVKRRFRMNTTESAHIHPVAPNVLDRQFDTERPDTKWAADITYIPTGEGWLFLAAVIDLCSRKIVGWAMSDNLKTQLCIDALMMALTRRNPQADLIHHSDRGVQYACGNYRDLLEREGITCSMSGRGDCYDNAEMESFFKTLKVELVYQREFATRAQARLAVFKYIEAFYNRKRLHSSLDYKSPADFEASLT
jgi:transposase InsO family protein